MNDTRDATLLALGQQIRDQRKVLKISAVSAALAAGMSRITWHRIERGEPTVALGAVMKAAQVLGLQLTLTEPKAALPVIEARQGSEWIPVRVRIAEYPELKRLAWQVHGTEFLAPGEAHGIYERNARHLDATALSPKERELMVALQQVFGKEG